MPNLINPSLHIKLVRGRNHNGRAAGNASQSVVSLEWAWQGSVSSCHATVSYYWSNNIYAANLVWLLTGLVDKLDPSRPDRACFLWALCLMFVSHSYCRTSNNSHHIFAFLSRGTTNSQTLHAAKMDGGDSNHSSRAKIMQMFH